mmetsp:Transcript_19273/g.39382  ORF Transcript_19273/g.39382 Transcript_19273/m.39382 type:complete len:179 (-) Transcript_19273:157-693(-)
MSLLLFTAVALSHTYHHEVGFLTVGGDAIPFQTNISFAAALGVCNATPTCLGFTFESDVPRPKDLIPKVYFKRHTNVVADGTWQTYLRDYRPPPPLMTNPCRNASAPQAAQPWCNATLPPNERVTDLLSRLTIAEKIGQLGTNAPAIASLNLKPYDWRDGRGAKRTHARERRDVMPRY